MTAPQQGKHRTAVLGLTAMLAAATLTLAACGSSGGKSSSSASQGGSGSASSGSQSSGSSGRSAAQAEIAKFSVKPTSIPITTPLSKTPPTGKKVTFVTQAAGDYKRWTAGFSAAAKVLGWTPTVQTVAPGGSPAEFNGLVQQAIQQGANYIAVGGPVFPTNNPMVAAAKAAKVPLFYFSTSQVPKGAANWQFAAVGAQSEYNDRGTLLADQAIVAAKGAAKVLFLNTPEFVVFQNMAEGLKAGLKTNCSKCTLDSLNVPVTDVLSGNADSAVVAYLRSHPDINVLACNESAFCTSVQVDAKAAGLKVGGKDGIPIVTGAQGDPQLNWLSDGTAVSGQGTPYEYIGWQLVDAMARYSVGDSIADNWQAKVPEYLYTAQNTPSDAQPYQGPTGFEDAFKKLWKIS